MRKTRKCETKLQLGTNLHLIVLARLPSSLRPQPHGKCTTSFVENHGNLHRINSKMVFCKCRYVTFAAGITMIITNKHFTNKLL
jgi:hypothetical protein